MTPFRREIPAFLGIDVEPDGFQTANLRWTGFEALLARAERLRGALAAAGGSRPTFTWYVRTDPQVAETFGRPDHLAHAYGDELRRLAGLGDTFGSHVHPVRWSPDEDTWIHDFADGTWAAHCIDVAFDAFEASLGAPVERHRFGAGFMNETVVGLLDDRGVRVDNTPEPGSHPWEGHELLPIESGIDATPRNAPTADCTTMPRGAYRPSRADFRRPGRGGDARQIVLLPLWATRLVPHEPLWRQAFETVKERVLPPIQPMYPSVWEDDPRVFWDLVERDLALRARPYLSLAIRTDAPGSADERRATALFDALPHHRLAKRLRFVDPLEVLPDLLPRSERQAPASTSLAQR